MAFVKELGWVINFQKLELNPTQHFDFLGYRFDISRGKVSPTEKSGFLDKGDRGFTNKFDSHSKNSCVIHRDSSLSRKDSHNRQITHMTVSVIPEYLLAISPIARHSVSLFRDFEKSSDLVERSKECVCRLSSPCRGAQSPDIHRCICKELGSIFGRPNSQQQEVCHRDRS